VKDNQRAINIVHACVVLHNFLLEEGDEWINRNQLVEQPVIGDGGQVDDNQGRPGQGVAFCNSIMGPALAAGRGPHGIITYDQQQQRQCQMQQQQQQQQWEQQQQH